jgi:hypothetical protein
LNVALGFPGNVLFEISLKHSVASLAEVSVFKNEDEVILSPYQWFSLHSLRWNSDYGRWILSVGEEQDTPKVESWFPRVGAT